MVQLYIHVSLTALLSVIILVGQIEKMWSKYCVIVDILRDPTAIGVAPSAADIMNAHNLHAYLCCLEQNLCL